MAGGRVAMGLLSLALLVSCGWDGEEDVSAEACLMSASIGFQGREYTATHRLEGLESAQVEVGRRLGVGEAPRCGGDARSVTVTVFAVVGMPVARAVYAAPDYGLMVRSHHDER